MTLLPYLVPVLWLTLLGVLGFYRKWRVLAAINVLLVLLTCYLIWSGGSMANDEATDQAAIGVLMLAGFAMFATGASIVASLVGLIVGHFAHRPAGKGQA